MPRGSDRRQLAQDVSFLQRGDDLLFKFIRHEEAARAVRALAQGVAGGAVFQKAIIGLPSWKKDC